jgi:hypothetical protein
VQAKKLLLTPYVRARVNTDKAVSSLAGGRGSNSWIPASPELGAGLRGELPLAGRGRLKGQVEGAAGPGQRALDAKLTASWALGRRRNWNLDVGAQGSFARGERPDLYSGAMLTHTF